MKTLQKIVLASLAALPLGSCGFSDSFRNSSDSSFRCGVEIGGKSVSPNPNKIPAAVKAEASNPALYSPYTGNSWASDQIGPYSASQSDIAVEIGLFAEISPFEDSGFFKPYLKLALKYAFGPDKGGEWSWYYTHKKDMRNATPSEWILYLRDDDRNVFPISPGAGVRMDLSDEIRMKLGAEYENVTWRYYKGYEAFGKPHLSLMGKSKHNVVNAIIGVQLLGDDEFGVDLDCVVPTIDERGFGARVSARFPF